MAYTELYPHPLRAGLYILILKETPLHYIDTKAKCRVMQERWEKKASEKFNKNGE